MRVPAIKDRLSRMLAWRHNGKDHSRAKLADELPLRAELYSVDQLDRHARAIAASHQLAWLSLSV